MVTIRLNDRGDHVDPDVVINGVGEWLGPVKVAAGGIEESGDTKRAHQGDEVGKEAGGTVAGRAWTGTRLAVSPSLGYMDSTEDASQLAALPGQWWKIDDGHSDA